MKKGTTPCMVLPGSFRSAAVFQATQLPSQPPNRPRCTGATSGWRGSRIHSGVSWRITFSTSAGSMATQPWSFRNTSARQCCAPCSLAELPPSSR